MFLAGSEAKAQSQDEAVCSGAIEAAPSELLDVFPEDAVAFRCAIAKLNQCMGLDSTLDSDVCMAHLNMQISQLTTKALDVETKRMAVLRKAQETHQKGLKWCREEHAGYALHYCKFRVEMDFLAEIHKLPAPEQAPF